MVQHHQVWEIILTLRSNAEDDEQMYAYPCCTVCATVHDNYFGLQTNLQKDNYITINKTVFNAEKRILDEIPFFSCCILEALTKLFKLFFFIIES
jgi:hypothetical protein